MQALDERHRLVVKRVEQKTDQKSHPEEKTTLKDGVQYLVSFGKNRLFVSVTMSIQLDVDKA